MDDNKIKQIKSDIVEARESLAEMEDFITAEEWGCASNAADTLHWFAGTLRELLLEVESDAIRAQAADDGVPKAKKWDYSDQPPEWMINQMAETFAQEPTQVFPAKERPKTAYQEGAISVDVAVSRCTSCGDFIGKHIVGRGCPPYPLPF